MTLRRTFGRNTLAVTTPHAAATLEAFRESQARLFDRLERRLQDNGDAAPTAPSGAPAHYYELIEGENGARFEAGYDIEVDADGAKELRLKILRVFGAD